MAYQVGTAWVAVKPDLRGFSRSISREFQAMRPVAERYGTLVGKSFARGFSDQLRVSFAKLPRPVIKPDADTAKADEKIDRAARDRRSKIKVDVDTSKLRSLVSLPALGAAGAITFGPQLAGLTAGLAGAVAAFGAAAASAGAFGAVAVPMFQHVTDAQKKYTTARQQYDKATTKAGRASALRAEQQALAGLTPAERGLAVQLDRLKGAWERLEKAEQPVVARALTPWFAVAREGFGFLPSLINPAADAIRILGEDARTSLQAPFWKTFFKDLGGSGSIAIQGFGRAAGYMADGLAHLFVVFKPWIDRIPGAVANWAASFDNWATHYNASGFDRFIRKTFSPQNTANMKQSLSAAGTLLKTVGKAVENINPSAMSGLTNVLVALSKLTPGQIEALGVLYVASRFTGTVGGLGQLATGKAGSKGKAGKFAAGGLAAAAGAIPLAGSLLAPRAKTTGGKLAAIGGTALTGGITGAGIGSMFGPLGTLAGAGIGAGYGAQAQAVKQFWPQILSGLKTGWRAVEGWFTGPFLSFFTKTVPRWFLHTIPDTLDWPGRQLIRLFGGWGSEAISGLLGGLQSAWHWVSAWVGRIGGWIGGAFKSAGSWLWNHGYRIIQGLSGGLQTAWRWVAGWFGRIGGWILGAFKAAGSWLWNSGYRIIQGLSGGLQTAWSWVWGWLGRIGGWVIGFFARAGSWLWNSGYRIIQGLSGGLQAAWAWVSAWFGRLSGWIGGAFASAGSWLWNKGYNIIQGLWGGLRNAWNKVAGWLGKIGGWIKSLKGPLSKDKTLLFDEGKAIMHGLLGGLKIGGSSVLSWVNALTGKIGGAAGSAVNLGKSMAAALGWTGPQWTALYNLWSQESGWRWNARNPSSGAYGIPQSLPASKMASAGRDWLTNAATQIRWGLAYIKGRYGSPLAAWAHEKAFNWYQKGSWSVPRTGPAVVHQGEMILPAGVASALRVSAGRPALNLAALADQAARRALVGGDLNVNVAQSGASAGDIIGAAVWELRQIRLAGAYG